MQNNTFKTKAISFAVACSLLSGCATGLSNDVNAMKQEAEKKSAFVQAQSIKYAKTKVTQTSERVNTPWLGNQRVVLVKNQLPSVFLDDFTFPALRQTNIGAIGTWVNKITGVPVRVSADALQAPTSSSTTTNNMTTDIIWSGGTLKDYLDLSASKLGLNWEYRNNEVVFYRFMTKTLRLAAIPGQFNTKGSIGKTSSASSGGSGGQGGSFSSNTSADTSATTDVWAGISEAIKVMMSKDGKLSINNATGTIVISDTPDIVSRVSDMVALENRKMSSQVYLSIDIISFTDGDTEGWSFEPNLAANLQNLIPGLTVKTTIAGQSILATEGSATALMTNPKSDLNGTSMIARAIAQKNKNVTVVHRNGVTMHNLPATIASTSQTGILSSTTPGTASIAGTGQVGINTTTIVTGLLFNVTPVITDNNKILLRGNVDITTKPTIRSVNSGGQTVEVADYNGSQAMINAVIKNGETLMLSGLNQSGGQLDKSGVTLASSLFGKSELAKKSLDNMVILVTPYIMEGAQ